MRPRLVMMIPLRRCGSNAIRLRMNLHPDFYGPYPLHLVDMEHIFPRYGDLQDDNNYFRLIVDMVGLQTMSLVKWTGIVFDPVDLFETLRDQPRSVYRIYGEMLIRAGEAHNAKVVMDKCQDSVKHYEEILSLFPDMLFLDVVRDPRAQVCSMNKAIIYDFDTRLNTMRWIESREWAERIRQTHPHHIMTIRYEDFVEKNEETMRKVCAFLQIPFDPTILDVSQSNEALSMSTLSPLWETNYSPPNSRYISRYMKSLSPHEISAIENMTLPWMERYGYVSITPHSEQFRKDMDWSIQESENNKKKAWNELARQHPQDYILRKARARYLGSL